MPHSTGSSDSGYYGVLKSKYNADGSTTPNSDRATSSITDDDEPIRCVSRRGTLFARTSKGKSRRLRKKTLPSSDTSSHSSYSSSELNSLTGEEERRHTLSREDIVRKVYVYFQSLLVTIRRQQKFFEQISGLMADADARWGAGGLRKGWVDPAGCFAPYGFGDSSKPTTFPGCWAVPHPSVHLALLASNLRDYLDFLCWLYPGVVGRGAGAGGTAATAAARSAAPTDDLSQQRGRAPDLGVSDDILPILMQLMQQMGPMNGGGPAAAPTTSMDEALLRQEKMRQHLQQASVAQTAAGWSVQPALMQQLVTQLNQMQFTQQQQQQPQQQQNQQTVAAVVAPVVVKKSTIGTGQVLHSSPSKSSSNDVTQRPPSEFYSAVVARRSPTYGEPNSGSMKSAASSTMTRHSAAPTKLERKAPIPVESVPLNSTATVSSLRDDAKTPCGECFA